MLSQCPICSAPVKDQAMECPCGELLTSWSTLRTHGEALRQRGLVLAAKGDHVGALVSFLEAALTAPQDAVSLLDAARSLTLLERYEDAMRLLAHATSKPATRPAAEAIAVAIKARARAAALAAKQQEETAAPVAEEALPAAEEVVVVKEDPPARPTLGLAFLERREAGLFGSKPRVADPAWKTALHLERSGADWRAEAPWLGAVLHGVKGHEVFHYLLGLGCWQRGDAGGALKHFARCLEDNPPVLNPAAYYVCLHLQEDAAGAVERLRGEYSFTDAEVENCLSALAERIRDGEDPGQYQAVRALMNQAEE
jgi:tetratricopeptide (TPR) repeat protein